MSQLTDRIIMIRPKHFGFNPETADDNAFQTNDNAPKGQISAEALKEFDVFVDLLREAGIDVMVIEDTDKPVKPDAVFPNNWLSTHEDGAVITYPMYSALRRNERREDIVDRLKEEAPNVRRYAFEQYEEQGQFLEGTGSMVLDRVNKVVYACVSERTNVMVLDKFCVLRGMRQVAFQAVSDGISIYHTNVLMALGDDYVVICMDSIPSELHKQELRDSFERTGKELIPISVAQMNAFAGNMLQLSTRYGGKLLVMSQTARESLTSAQVKVLEKYNPILIGSIPTIEKYGGGSVRCMIAENFLD